MDFLTANSGSIIAVAIALIALAFNFLGKKKVEAEQRAENVDLQVDNARLDERVKAIKEQEDVVKRTIYELAAEEKNTKVKELNPSQVEDYWNKKK